MNTINLIDKISLVHININMTDMINIIHLNILIIISSISIIIIREKAGGFPAKETTTNKHKITININHNDNGPAGLT